MRSDGLGLTRLGAGYVILLVLVAVAGANTGNNGLYLVVATMGAVLLVAYTRAVFNVRGLRAEILPPPEAWAGRPAPLGLRVESRRRFGAHQWLRFEVEPGDLEPAVDNGRQLARLVLPLLGAREQRVEEVGVWVPRRGRYRLRAIRVRSLFPWGLFRKGRRLSIDADFLVYPALHPRGARLPVRPGRAGEHPTRRQGWGHELLGLREYRVGDDLRDIHWKQTARTGNMILRERETERNRRLQIVLDNGLERAPDEGQRGRFETLVSEAATAAIDHLEQGHEVALRTRDDEVPFAAGKVQRRRILEVLALVELRGGESGEVLGPDPTQPHLRLAVADRGEAA